MAVPYEITADGFESQMQVNHIAHWVLTTHLLPVLLSASRASDPGSVRVVCVASEGHNSFGVKGLLYDSEEIKNYGNYGRYGLSKLANVLHATNLIDSYGPGSLSAQEGNGELWTASLHPGLIDTQLNESNRDRAPWTMTWIHRVLILFGIIRPREDGCVSSLYTERVRSLP